MHVHVHVCMMYFVYCSSSYYEFSHDGSPSERQKSSGLLVYTGSGSTSWSVDHLIMHIVHVQCMSGTKETCD